MLFRAAAGAVASLCLLAGSAHAAITPNLITNPGAEDSPGATSEAQTMPPAGWESVLGASVVIYGSGDFPSTAVSQEITGGNNFFTGGATNDAAVIFQEKDLSAHAALIDSGRATMTLSGYLGGYATQEDNVSVVAALTDEAGSAGAFASIGPVTAAERNNQTTLLRRTFCTTVPPSVRRLLVAANFQRTSGTSSDGYADNLSLTLSDDPCPPAGTTPLEPPAPPVAGESANADRVSGTVRVRVPGSSGFVELEDLGKIPVGSEVDAKSGAVSLESAANATGSTTQRAIFSEGTFRMAQPSNASITELRLSEKFDKCPRGRKADPELGPSARTRRLWGRGRGKFRTRGRRASATVRGKAQTRWLVQDTCAGTLIRVTQGSVTVRDFGKKRNVRLKAPGRYLAK